MIVDRYYYGILPDNEKAVYREIYQGCMSHKDIIPVSATEEEMSKSYDRIANAVMDDNPLLYYVNQSYMEFARDAAGNVAVIPQYFFSKEKLNDYNRRIQDSANKLIASLELTEGNDYDKVLKIHDYICSHVEYDHGGADTSNVPRFIAAHNIIGVLAHRKAQCEGIAKTVKVLLNAVDIPCIFVTGEARDTNGQMGRHSWNIVNIGGKPYQFDVTMDIGLGIAGYVGYDYCNNTDSQMRKDHVFSTGYPKCTSSDESYFVRNDLVFTSKRKLREHISKKISAGERMIYFKTAGKLKASEIWEEILMYGYGLLRDVGAGQVQYEHIVNEKMNTCRIVYL